MALTKVKAGNILLTTPGASSNDVTPATTAYVTTALANLADSASSTLDTLNELAAALGDDANFSTTVTKSIALKAPLASPTFTGTLEIPNLTISSAQGSDGQVLTSTGSGIAWEAIPASGVDGIVSSANATAITIDSSENVGIGASSPSAPLHILKDGGNAEVEILRLSHGDTDHANGQNDAALAITFDIPASEAGTRDTRLAAKIVGGKGINGANDWFTSGANTNFQGQLDFYTRKDDVLTNQMTLSHLGLGIGTAAPAVSLDVGTSTNAIRLPNGTTAQRPSSPATGMIRYNTTLAVVEEYRGSAWKNLSDAFSGSGGTKTTSGSYTYHTFTSSGAITFTGGGTIDILVVGGGAGGGTNANVRGSGGGAGGLIFISGYPVDAGTYAAGVGSGGAENANGTNSTFAITGGTTLTAIGGGVGGNDDSTDNGADGGSGGGQWYPGYAGASGTQPTNTNDGTNTYNSTGFGNDGGTSGGSHPYGSGGGGAGGVGLNWNSSGGPVGGVGKDMSATFGTSVGENGYFAGGGGSGSYPPIQDVKYVGGTGGGGRGWNNGTETEQNGTANTGGGGGAGGSGGSGIVILRYVT